LEYLAKEFFKNINKIPKKGPRNKAFAAYFETMSQCRTKYCVHLDADIIIGNLIPNYNWIEEGILLLARCPDCVIVSAAGGPPPRHVRKPGNMWQNTDFGKFDHGHSEKPGLDPRGFWTLQSFSTRMYFYENQTFRKKVIPIFMHNPDDSAEEVVGRTLREQNITRADLMGAYHFHTGYNFHGSMADMAAIVRCAETGFYPKENEGIYELVGTRSWIACK